MTDLKKGWDFPGRAAKPHYFEEGQSVSICGRWWFTGPREQPEDCGNDTDCQACVKRLAKKRGKV